MDEKDPLFSINSIDLIKTTLPYLSTLFLSCWGGLVSYIQKIRIKSSKFNWKELAFDLVMSSFAGFLTSLACQYSKLDAPTSSILIAISGHMGTRAIASFENFRDKIFGIPSDEIDIYSNAKNKKIK